MDIWYEPHPVSPERKKELRALGYKIMDVQFKPKDAEQAEAEDKPKRKPRSK